MIKESNVSDSRMPSTITFSQQLFIFVSIPQDAASNISNLDLENYSSVFCFPFDGLRRTFCFVSHTSKALDWVACLKVLHGSVQGSDLQHIHEVRLQSEQL